MLGWTGSAARGMPAARRPGGERVLVVHRAERATALADGLADLLTTPLDDPFAPELVAVPAKGVERWLAQRLSHRLGVGPAPSGSTAPASTDGVCANVTFPSPRRMLDDAVLAVAPDAAEQLAAWGAERLTWPVLDTLDAHLDEDWCRIPRRHLISGGESTNRRLSLASHVARLFDAYARSRPEMLRRWADGDHSLADGAPIDESEQWQPRLWRLLLARLGGTSPVDLHQQVCQAVRADPNRLAAPHRLSVFGASRLARTDLDLLAAIAEQRDVHLWLHHASPALWEAVAKAPPATRRADDATRLRNPLLRSLSRDVRELQHLLRAHAPQHSSVHHPSPPPPHPESLLARLRADLAADRVPQTPAAHDTGDRSVQVHACHGRTRQVEVLREVVVGLLADDPTLEPRDILVMCPDVEAFAPLLAATFATRPDEPPAPHALSHPADRLRVRVADRALHQSNPLIGVLSRLLELGPARHTAGEVLDLAEHPAVARRFGFDDDAVERLRDWVAGAHIRWGLHDEHRRAWQLGSIPDGTWRQGLDRLLLGAAVEQDQAVDIGTLTGLVPLDDVDSADLDLVGRLAELVDRLEVAQTELSTPHTPAEWADVLERATLRLAAPEPRAAWQELELRDVLEEALVEPTTAHPGDGAAAPGAPLTLAELAPMLQSALAGRPTRTGFRTGALTVCTLVPMRSVPHRVVVLLGLDDGVFPRQSVRDGDDLLTRDPWVGDRDPRSEDRQLLLDAICAAGEHLVVTYTGHDERTGATVPPAVPLGELLDAVDRTVVGPPVVGQRRQRGRDAITTHHPLQPFDPRAFTPGALGTAGTRRTPRPFSFDPRAYAGAVAASGQRRRPPPLLSGPLPALPRADVALEDLVTLLVDPARGFLRQRLDLTLTERDDDPDDALPLELGPLEKWDVGNRLLRERLGGRDPAQARLLERGRGALPPGPLGDRVLAVVTPDVEDLTRVATPLLGRAPEAYDVTVDLRDGTRLTGTVGGVRGDTLVRVEYSRLAPKHRLDAWIRLLALTAGVPATEWVAVTLGRSASRAKAPCARSTAGPIPSDVAVQLLRQYVALYREGLRSPLPVPGKTAATYAAARWAGRRPLGARVLARQEWDDRSGQRNAAYPGEQSDAAQILVHGGKASFDDLLESERAGPGDYHNTWPADEEGDRFGVLARRFWDPLLKHETLEVL